MRPRTRPILHPHDENFLKEIKRTILNTAIALFFTLIVTQISFYFTTRSTLQFHEQAIQELKQKIDYLIQIHIKKD